MTSFSSEIDGTNHAWDLKIRLSQRDILFSRHGFDIHEFKDWDKIDDLPLFSEMLWSLCERQANSRKISKEDFQESIYGEVFDTSQEAFGEAVADFSPQRIKSHITTILKMRKTEAEARTDAIEKLAEKMPEVMTTKIDQTLSEAIEDVTSSIKETT